MPQKYYSILTDIGIAKISNATVTGEKCSVTNFAVGDGSGTYYTPQSSQTDLKNEVWRGVVATYELDEMAGNIINITAVIPASVGGFTIRECGIFNAENQMIAIANCPDIVKVRTEDGAASELMISMSIAIQNTDNIQIVVDPTVIIATKADIEKIKIKYDSEIQKLQTQIDNIHTFSGDYNDLTNKPALFNGDYNSLTNKPTSMPANGGNADTVNGHTVASNVPANAQFTDTKYNLASSTNDGLMSASCYNYIAALSSTPIGYVTGTYSGTGGQQVFNLGFTPSAVIINTTNDHNLNAYRCVLAIRGSAGWIGHCYIIDNGFSVVDSCSNGYHVYNYIAFK